MLFNCNHRSACFPDLFCHVVTNLLRSVFRCCCSCFFDSDCLNFSRLKKEKTNEKRDASEDKKTNEIDPATTTGTHAVKLPS